MNTEVMYLSHLRSTTDSSMYSLADEIARKARERLTRLSGVAVTPPMKAPAPVSPIPMTRTQPQPANEFKAGTWGKGRSNKVIIMDTLLTKGKYMLSTWNGRSGDPHTVSTNRVKEMNNVRVGDTLHMKSPDEKTHYKGLVRSEFRGMHGTELITEYHNIVEAAWGSAGPADRYYHFKVCDVEWTKHPLSDAMNTYLNKLVKNGGGCTKQCGTLIPLI